jgi:ribonucleoside-triphosphate reductase
MHNCCLVNLEDMLLNGTVISETMIERPKSFSTACNIATQAIAQIASSQYGGQSITLSHLVPFVDVSRQKFRKEVALEFETAGVKVNKKQVDEIAEMRVKKEIERGCQVIQYQVITLMTTNGQAPFITVYMYLDEVPEGQQREDLAMVIEEMLKQRILGVKNEKGQLITPAFPKLIYVLDEDNIHEDSKYWYLTELAAKCTAKRLVPDYISAKKMKELKKGDVYPCMGCRSFLTPDSEDNAEGLCNAGNKSHALNYKEGDHKYYGRFNQGVVTINLVDVACSSYKDEEKFWELMEERTELCKRALMCRHNRLLGTPSDVAPILGQNGALARLQKGEVIDPLLFGNYSTISLGYAGLCECTKYMKGVSHTDPR